MSNDKVTDLLNLHFGITKVHDSRVLEAVLAP